MKKPIHDTIRLTQNALDQKIKQEFPIILEDAYANIKQLAEQGKFGFWYIPKKCSQDTIKRVGLQLQKDGYYVIICDHSLIIEWKIYPNIFVRMIRFIKSIFN